MEVFLVFHSIEILRTYVKKQKKSDSIEILREYSNFPILFARIKTGYLDILESNTLIQKIDVNTRCYLSNINIDNLPEENTLNFEEKYNRNQKKTIKIAIIDSGIDRNHSDLRKIPYSKLEVVVESWDDIVGHGTLISGIVAEIVPKIEIIDVKVVGRSGLFYTSDVLRGLDLLFSETINIVLLGFSNPTQTDGNDVLSQVCRVFSDQGAYIVAPAGNFGPDRDTIGFASHLKNGFCIGSLQSNDKLSFFSSRDNKGANKPDFFVLGENITSTAAFHGLIGEIQPNYASYRILSGTSVSAASFTGLLANILIAFPEYSYSDIIEFLSDFNPSTRKIDIEEVQRKIHELRPPPVSFKKVVIIASAITAILGILGLISMYLI